ncbi:MAG: 4Fe-4S cluster-binding domain-containing protein [Synergistaceae bacterium]|nr:4Fe-4S cluster-binding domain-containing protein [Synergistaceae bacterium]
MKTALRKLRRYLRIARSIRYRARVRTTYLLCLLTGKKRPGRNLTIDVHLTDHCNLNCAYCSHFAPLSDKWFLDIETFTKDMLRLSELIANKAPDIYLLGGEPLLHPNVEKFFPVARAAFPVSLIAMFTNGLLLRAKDEAFWRACRENRIEIWMTVYPNMEDMFHEVRTIGAQHGVTVAMPNRGDKSVETFSFIPFDLSGSQPKLKSFALCGSGNTCVTLRDGRLYTCLQAAHLHIFNDYVKRSHATPPPHHFAGRCGQLHRHLLREERGRASGFHRASHPALPLLRRRPAGGTAMAAVDA